MIGVSGFREGGAAALSARDRGASVELSNGMVRTEVDLLGGMMPEFGRKTERGFMNAHWVPPFRGSGEWSPGLHQAFWNAKLLHHIAGDFLCCPNFGPPCQVDGAALPPHGWTAVDTWRLLGSGADGQSAWADFSLEPGDASMNLAFLRRDFLLSGEPAYWSILEVRNRLDRPVSINVGRHNTLGPPFLEPGSRVGLCAETFMTPPPGTEFDATGRLETGASFDSLERAPLRSGGFCDLRRVPGMVGATDFVSGPVPRGADLGYSCATSPSTGLAYLCVFPGPAGLPDGEIALSFNDLWMQYGGRRFTPWAEAEGAPDRTFCLGTENATGAFANSLAWARTRPEIMGSPTMVELPARGSRRLVYGVALAEVGKDAASAGIDRVERISGGLELLSPAGQTFLPLSADFGPARRAFESLIRAASGAGVA